MSDLIRRSALIKKIRDYADEVGCVRGEYELANGILKAISVVEDAPTVEEKSVHGEWILCEVVDHPEHCRDCEVTRKDTVGYVRDIAFYTDKWRRLENEMPIDVIAWKEPSAPYNADMRGGKNE